jgi:glutamate-1-semialdehyde 2,1-aminomutase
MHNFQKRLLKAIPGGAHTYSRGYDQFPQNAPEILSHGKGAYVFDPQGKKYLDYGMGLRSVNIGYAEDEIDNAAIAQIKLGNNLTRPSLIELQAAELLLELIDSADMVKFTKNGSTAVTAAVKLARAFTGREIVARCAQHPFFSFDDWFIGSTLITRGVPPDTLKKTKTFLYNNIQSLKKLIDENPNQIACVVLEPASTDCPSVKEKISGCCNQSRCVNYKSLNKNYLQEVQDICKLNGIVFILDETITGFRWNLKGGQKFYGVNPDLSVFGKAMANGYSLACVAGKRDIMKLASIEFQHQERVFFLSSTHGAEMSSLGAFVANVAVMKSTNVISKQWEYGELLIKMIRRKALEFGIESSFKIDGVACSPFYLTLDEMGSNSLELRTLFNQELIKNNVMMPWISISFRHGTNELALTEAAIDSAFKVYSRALVNGVDKYLKGASIKPVFRKYN